MPSRNTTTSSEFPEPEPIHRNIPDIFQIFHSVQFNTVQHKKYIKELKKLFLKIDQDSFRMSFTNALHYLFTFGEANGNVDRVMQFVANFSTSLNDEEEFLHYIFGVVFDCVAVSGQGIRGRACQLLGLLLSALGDDASLNDDICDKILATQLERLQDVRGSVRCRAVLALQRLQNPSDTDDPVTRAYTFHMSCDPSSAVRRAVVLSLGKNGSNLLHVLERLCDVDESVRKAAFLYVSSINVMQLKVRQRVHILKVGLTERSPRVRRVVETALLPGWLGAYHGNVLELLAAVRLDNLQGAKESAVVAGNLLQSLFKHQQIAELLEWLPVDPKIKLIPAEHLNKESAWYWRHLVCHLHAREDTNHLEQLLPELVIFTGYVRALVESPCPNPVEQPVDFSKRQYVLQELISIFPVYDMADEVGRNTLQSLLYDILTGNHGPLDKDVIQAIMRSVDLVVPDVKKRIEFVAGIISEIHEPACDDIPLPPTPVESTETKILKAELRVSLNEAQEEQEDAVRAQNFVLAAECKQKVDALYKKLSDLNANIKEAARPAQPVPEVIREKKNDPETLNKCLIILNMLLDTPDILSMTPVLRSLFQDFEVMVYQNVDIRENALQTVALYSTLDEDFAKEQKAFFFSQFMDLDNERLLVTALKCVIDIICIHGVKIFNIGPENKEANQEEGKEDEPTKNKSLNKSKRKSKADKSRSIRQSRVDCGESDSEDEEINKEVDAQSTHDTIIELFLRLMDSECSEYRAVVAEGLCRLLMGGRLCSSSLISRLLLLWFNPATEEEDDLKQILGTFFPLFAVNAETGQDQLEAAFLPTVITLANAPLGSPLAEVDYDTVLKFIIGLTMPTVAPTAHNVHSNLAVVICSTLDRGEENAAPLLCRALALLTPPRAPALCRDLIRSADALMDLFTDKASFRNVSRFHANVSTALQNLEQRASAANPPMTTLPEGTEPANSMDSSSVASASENCQDKLENGLNKPEDDKPTDDRKVSFEDGRISSSTVTSDPTESESTSARSSKSNTGSTDFTSARSSKSNTGSTDFTSARSSKSNTDSTDSTSAHSSKSNSESNDSEHISSPPRKMKRITAAEVARRALLKTPKSKRNQTPSSPSSIPSRAVEPKTPATRRSTRTPASKQSAAKSEATTSKATPATKGKRGSKKSQDSDEEVTGKGRGRAAKGLSKQLEQVSEKEIITAKPRTKPKKQSFEIFEIKKGGTTKKGAPKKGAAPSKIVEKSDSSSSSEDLIEDSSDEETMLHTICHDAEQEMSLIDPSSSDDELDARDAQRAANVTVPETPETSEQSSDSSD